LREVREGKNDKSLNKHRTTTSDMDFFSHLCHQKEERCLRFRGRPMPLCSRCLGFYIFLLFAIIISLLAEILFGAIHAIPPMTMFIIFCLTQLPLVVDGSLQYKTRYESTNVRRFISGMLSGADGGTILIWLIFEFV